GGPGIVPPRPAPRPARPGTKEGAPAGAPSGRLRGKPPRGTASAQDRVHDQAGGDGDQQVVAVVVAHPAMAVRRVAQAVAVVVVDHVDRALVVVDVAATGPARAAVARGRSVVVHWPEVGYGGAAYLSG